MSPARVRTAQDDGETAPEPVRQVLETPCGRVRLTAPTGTDGDVYWRLEWYDEDDERHQTTGGRTKKSAQAKAAKVLKRLDDAVKSEGRERLGTAVDAYAAFCGQEYSANHAYRVDLDLKRKALQPLRGLRCEAFSKRNALALLDGCSTRIVADRLRSMLNAFLEWGHERGYFSAAQMQMLANYRYSPATPPVAKPQRRPSGRVQGEAERYVTDDEVPTHEAVADLGDALQERLRYGKLQVELIAASGLRCGEHLALAAPVIDLAKREVGIDWQVLPRKDARTGARLARPKGGKTRTTVFAEVTPTGFNLAEALQKRRWEVEQEHKAGRNPHRLLFPAPRGGYHWPGNYTNDYFTPAALAAGWEQLTWTERRTRNGPLVVVECHQLRHTQHSLRHRFAKDHIDVYGLNPAELMFIGGWESMQVVYERYYGLSRGTLDAVRAKTEAV